jgi:hypothetical protein
MSHLHSNNKWQCIGFKDKGTSHPRIEIAYGKKCHICGGDERGENNISPKLREYQQLPIIEIIETFSFKDYFSQLDKIKRFQLGLTLVGFVGLLLVIQFCNSTNRQGKNLYNSAIDEATKGNVPEAIEKLCKLPESSQYFNVAQAWIQRWNQNKYWHDYVKSYLEKQGSSCPVGNAVLHK